MPIHSRCWRTCAKVDDANGKDRAFKDRIMRMLLDAKTVEDDQVLWKAGQTGIAMAVEQTGAMVEIYTGLAVQALLKWGGEPSVAAKAMNYIVAGEGQQRAWGRRRRPSWHCARSCSQPC